MNIRWALQTAIEEEVLSGSAEAALLELARAVRFKVRSHDELLEAASGSPWHSEMRTLLDFMQQNPLRTNRKRLDALLLLEAMQESTRLESPLVPKYASR